MIKTNNINNLILLCSLSLLTFSCSKEDETDCNPGGTTHVLSTCLESYFFGNGSYWVYQDTSSLQIDSTYIVSWEHGWEYNKAGSGCQPTTSVEEITFDYKSNLRGLYQEIMLLDYISENGTFNSKQMACSNETLDSLVVNNVVYYNVIKGGTSSSDLYYKKSIGIIRRVEYENNSSTTYDLINYNVNFFTTP